MVIFGKYWPKNIGNFGIFFFFQTFPNKWKIFLRDFQDEENLSVNRLTITYIFPNSNCIFNTEIEKPMC